MRGSELEIDAQRAIKTEARLMVGPGGPAREQQRVMLREPDDRSNTRAGLRRASHSIGTLTRQLDAD